MFTICDDVPLVCVAILDWIDVNDVVVYDHADVAVVFVFVGLVSFDSILINAKQMFFFDYVSKLNFHPLKIFLFDFDMYILKIYVRVYTQEQDYPAIDKRLKKVYILVYLIL